jgi:hypothetical protein
MAVAWKSLDYSDPCALLTQLRPLYYRLVAGASEEEIEGADGRRVRFTRGDLDRLGNLVRGLETDCAGKTGGPRKRYALIGRMRSTHLPHIACTSRHRAGGLWGAPRALTFDSGPSLSAEV